MAYILRGPSTPINAQGPLEWVVAHVPDGFTDEQHCVAEAHGMDFLVTIHRGVSKRAILRRVRVIDSCQRDGVAAGAGALFGVLRSLRRAGGEDWGVRLSVQPEAYGPEPLIHNFRGAFRQVRRKEAREEAVANLASKLQQADRGSETTRRPKYRGVLRCRRRARFA